MTSVQVVVAHNRFPVIGRSFEQKVEDVLDDAVLTCIEVADPLTRRDTGALVNNKTIERSRFGRVVTWNQDYAGYQNGGTVHMSGTHFADRGADAAEPVLTNGMKGIF
jgi:hypothetical protein